MLLRDLSAQDARPHRRLPALPETDEAQPAHLPGLRPARSAERPTQGYTIQHAGNGYGRIQSPAYIAWKRLHYEEILQRHQPPETFTRFWSRVHELFERQTGLSVYMNF